MNKRIKALALQAYEYETFDEYNHKTVKHYKFNKEKFAELIIEDAESEAISLIKFIARDYVELSHDKVQWQRNDYIKRCRKFLDEYRRVEE